VIFDTLCRVARRYEESTAGVKRDDLMSGPADVHMAYLCAGVASDAALFDLRQIGEGPGAAEAARKQIEGEGPAMERALSGDDVFFAPFPAVAVESFGDTTITGACMSSVDCVPNQVGCADMRLLLFLGDTDAGLLAFAFFWCRHKENIEGRPAALISSALVAAMSQDGRIVGAKRLDKDDLGKRPFKDKPAIHIDALCRAIRIINSPANLVIERVGEGRHHSNKVRRREAATYGDYLHSRRRPTLLVFPRSEGQRLIVGEEGGPRLTRGHSRRRHWRTLRSERFKQPGRRVLVRECWVGPQETERNGHRYKVRLDVAAAGAPA
jgi:hypothetical protein